MSSKSYTLNVLVRIILLTAAIMAFFFALHQEKWYVTTTVSGILIPVFMFSIFRYTHRFRKEISEFLLAIRNKEYSQYQNSRVTKKSDDLNHALHIIARELQDVSIEKEMHYHYLRAIVENINTGIISYKEEGEIHLFNRGAGNLLQISAPKHIDSFRKRYPHLHSTIKAIKPGERKLVNLRVDNEVMKMALQAREFKQYGHTYRLLSLQDIRAELDKQELESYQKLIKVLRHEIMNSATPISSLSEAMEDTVRDLLENKERSQADLYNELNDLLVSTQTVHTRTNGLLKFVNNYRKLTNIPAPAMEPVDLKEVIHHSLHLLSRELDQNNIRVITELPKELTIRGDFDQVEQVVINILLNAIHALVGKETGEIKISGKNTGKDKCSVRFSDNGAGIGEEEMEKIFIPFYTTKKQGSGIGLSLSKQIMKMHQGDIQIHSIKNEGTTCELIFE